VLFVLRIVVSLVSGIWINYHHFPSLMSVVTGDSHKLPVPSGPRFRSAARLKGVQLHRPELTFSESPRNCNGDICPTCAKVENILLKNRHSRAKAMIANQPFSPSSIKDGPFVLGSYVATAHCAAAQWECSPQMWFFLNSCQLTRLIFPWINPIRAEFHSFQWVPGTSVFQREVGGWISWSGIWGNRVLYY
jgi:hypothetical protein